MLAGRLVRVPFCKANRPFSHPFSCLQSSGPNSIATVDFSAYKVLYIPSAYQNGQGGGDVVKGINNTQNDALANRRALVVCTP